jgi:hypothetical protein
MSSVTFNTLLNDYARFLGRTRNSSVATDVNPVPDDFWHETAVGHLNNAIRWAWSMDDSRFVWPQTLTSSATVPVTGGIIAWSDVGNSDWVSFWQSDPRLPPSNVIPGIPYYYWGWCPTVPPVPVTWDGTQFNVQDSSIAGPVFAFYRTAVPQGTFALANTDPTYATPTLPDFFRDAVVRYAVAEYLSVPGSQDRETSFRQKALDWYDSNKASILNSDAGYPWQGNIITP